MLWWGHAMWILSKTNYTLLKYKFLYIFFISQIIYSQQFRNITSISDLNEISGNNGVAVADYDQDGDLDIFIVSEDGNENISRLLQNTNNGNFVDVTENSGINQNLNHEIDLINYDDNGEFSFDTIEHGDRLAASWWDFNLSLIHISEPTRHAEI